MQNTPRNVGSVDTYYDYLVKDNNRICSEYEGYVIDGRKVASDWDPLPQCWDYMLAYQFYKDVIMDEDDGSETKFTKNFHDSFCNCLNKSNLKFNVR